MANIELNDSEIDLLWTVFINESCTEFMLMQKYKTPGDLLKHKQRKDICDGIIQKIKQFRM
jgi:hypothetical protein